MTHADRAHEEIRRRIVRGVLAPGARFTEGAIAAEIGFGRTPVREALVRLQREGLVSVSPRTGCRVTDVTLRDVNELCELREAIEGRVVELAVSRVAAGLATIERLDHACEVNVDLDGTDIGPILDANRAFHVELSELSGNSRLVELQCRVIDEFDRLFWLGLPASPHIARMRDEHREIVAAVRAGDAQQARAAVLGHCRTFQSVVAEAVLSSNAVAATSLSHVRGAEAAG
jgi:DNA-binding GntR family transcriptional regulator